MYLHPACALFNSQITMTWMTNGHHVPICHLDNAQCLLFVSIVSPPRGPPVGKFFFFVFFFLELMWVVQAIQTCSGVLVCLSGLPTAPPPIHTVLSEGQFLWTQTTVPLVLPELEMHSAILSCVCASRAGCQTCGLYSYASSFFF